MAYGTPHAGSHNPNSSDALDLTKIHYSGAYGAADASLPALPNGVYAAGVLIFNTDTGRLFRSLGSSWLQMGFSATSDSLSSARLTGNIPAAWLGTTSTTASVGNDARFVNPTWTLTLRTSGPYTILATDSIVVANAASLTLHMPSAVTAGAGRVYTVKNGASGTSTTIDSPTAGTIDGAASYAGLTVAYQAISLVSDGSNWLIF